jgi:hypothetical protein
MVVVGGVNQNEQGNIMLAWDDRKKLFSKKILGLQQWRKDKMQSKNARSQSSDLKKTDHFSPPTPDLDLK